VTRKSLGTTALKHSIDPPTTSPAWRSPCLLPIARPAAFTGSRIYSTSFDASTLLNPTDTIDYLVRTHTIISNVSRLIIFCCTCTVIAGVSVISPHPCFWVAYASVDHQAYVSLCTRRSTVANVSVLDELIGVG
jgi:hypothetical protein